MTTLSSYSKQLKIQLDLSDPAGQIINFAQKKISRETSKLLNKNQNFVLTQNKINKKGLHNQLDKFYRRIKLKAHFQDTHKQVNLSDKEYRFANANTKFLQEYTTQ